MKIRSVVFLYTVANGQTDRQTDKQRDIQKDEYKERQTTPVITFPSGGDNNKFTNRQTVTVLRQLSGDKLCATIRLTEVIVN